MTTPPKDAAKLKEVPDLTRGETWLLYLTIALLLAVGTIGLVVSFQSVSAKAALWGFETPELLPIAIDLAIPGFTIAHLLLIRMDMELAWVRAVPWTLTAATIYLNVQAGTNTAAKIGHGALPLVWVVCSEIAGHVYRALIGRATGKRMERIRRSRLVMAPFRTSSLWRRMVLWEETSYSNAITREQEFLLARADLRERHGRWWRFKAPIRERVLLRLGELTPAAVLPPAGPVTGGNGRPELPPAVATKAPGDVDSLPPAAAKSATVSLAKVPPTVGPTVDRTATTPAAIPAPTQRQDAATPVAEAADKTAASLSATARQTAPRPTANRKKTTRRSMSEWVELAGPVFHAEFERLRRQPTGDEFAEAIKKAKLGTVSASTAKNIRAEILDRAELPVLD